MRILDQDHPLLETVAQAPLGSSQYHEFEAKIRHGLVNITSGTHEAPQLKGESDGERPARRNLPVDYPNEFSIRLYNILREHKCCTSNGEIAQGVLRTW